MTLHAWHDVPLGDRIEEHFSAVIEIPKGSKMKYELDKDTGLLRVDRILHSAVHYPANYGFLPRTYCDDGDPLGVLGMSDEKGRDDKVIAVHVDDPEYEPYRDIAELPRHRLKELERFFLDYKALENKVVNVEDLKGRARAEDIVREAARLYAATIRR